MGLNIWIVFTHNSVKAESWSHVNNRITIF
nr:MAG TPA: hypothetical protein [Caudoviricetes sp.]